MNIVCNPGDYFECGENETYSKILIISNTHCIIKHGLYIGETMTIDEWLTTKIKKTSRHEPDTILRTDSINSIAPSVNPDKKEKPRTPVLTDLCCNSQKDIKLEESQIKPKILHVNIVTPNLVTVETHKIEKKTYPWYYKLFICCRKNS